MENQNETKVAKIRTAWMRLDELKAWKEHHDNWLNHMLWDTAFPTRQPQPDDNVKLAFVDGNRMIGVDNKTMIGYELDDKTPTVKIPLVETKYDVFVRWARMMDV